MKSDERPYLTEPEQLAIKHIRDLGTLFIVQITESVPEGRDRDIAAMKIQEAVFWAVHGMTA